MPRAVHGDERPILWSERCRDQVMQQKGLMVVDFVSEFLSALEGDDSSGVQDDRVAGLWVSSLSRPFELCLKFPKTGYEHNFTLFEIGFNNLQKGIQNFSGSLLCHDLAVKFGKENALDLLLLFFEVNIFHDIFSKFRFGQGHSVLASGK
jgi:hypothetical protein